MCVSGWQSTMRFHTRITGDHQPVADVQYVSITWLTGALLMVPTRLSRAVGLLAARPVMTP